MNTLLYKSIFVAIMLSSTWLQATTDNQLKILPSTQKARIKVTDRVWPEQYGQADVCLWKGDKLSAVSITIDDNTRPDHDFWLEMGEKYGWKWTWFIITGRISDKRHFTYNGNWETWQNIATHGHEIQSHTVNHLPKNQKDALSTEDEYKLSQTSINEKFPTASCHTLAYPGGGRKNSEELALKYYSACRGTVGHLNKRANINYRNANSIGNMQNFFKDEKHWASFAGTLNPKNKRKFRAWYCTHFHRVRDRAHLIKCLDYLKTKENDVWVATFMEAAFYGQQSDTANVTTNSADAEKIILTLTDKMDDAIFTLPLTIKVKLKPDWAQVKAEQNGKPLKAKVITHNGATFALVNAIPDKGKIVLTK